MRTAEVEIPDPCRFAWRHLDRAAATLLWEELIDWVGWLRYRYQLSEYVRPCWYRHGPVVEELTALMVAHTAAYTGEDSYREDLAAWHQQWMWPLMHRIASITDFSTCTEQQCRHKPDPQYTLDGLKAFVDADIAARPEPALVATPRTETRSGRESYIIPEDTMRSLCDSGLAIPVPGTTAMVRYDGKLWISTPAVGGWLPDIADDQGNPQQ
jgi:hypothetical protein